MEKLDPITREEIFMAEAAGDSVPSLDPITRKEHFLKRIAENAGSGGGGGAQPDWNANEGEPGHILNRTHWEGENVEVDIIPLTTLTPAPSVQLGYHALLPIFELKVGKTYTVIFDGTSYTCTALAIAMGSMSGVGIGNPIFAGGENNGMPFGLSSLFNGDVHLFMGMDVNEHTVRVIEEQPVYHKLPEGYIIKGDFAVELSETDNGYTLLTPWEDIISARRAGKNIYGLIRSTNIETDQYSNLTGFTNSAKYFTCTKMDYSVYTPKCEMVLFNFAANLTLLNIVRDENGITTITNGLE